VWWSGLWSGNYEQSEEWQTNVDKSEQDSSHPGGVTQITAESCSLPAAASGVTLGAYKA
jgi:hypothetical protein